MEGGFLAADFAVFGVDLLAGEEYPRTFLWLILLFPVVRRRLHGHEPVHWV